MICYGRCKNDRIKQIDMYVSKVNAQAQSTRNINAKEHSEERSQRFSVQRTAKGQNIWELHMEQIFRRAR